MSNYCACSGGDEEYTIELNQQGPEGPQGPVGPEGFSPSISIKTNTDKAYVLTVVNKEGNFDTPNLYGETEKLNADLSNIPNPAYINGVTLYHSAEDISSIELNRSSINTDIDGNLMLTATASEEEATGVFNYELVVNPKEQRLELHDNEGTVKIVATTDYIPTINVATTTTAGIVKPDGSTITIAPDGTISAVQQDLSNLATKEELTTLDTTLSADIATLDADKLASANIIAGANITIDRSGNNLTINSIGGGSGGSSIDDSTTSTTSTWSSSKINSEITTVANTKNDNIFDISKFTIVGSPIITDDGIASGFSSSNYLQTPSIIDFANANSWILETSFTTPNAFTTDNSIYSGNISYNGVRYTINSTGKLSVAFSSVSTGYNIGIITGSQLLPNTRYYSKVVFNGSKYSLYLSNDGVNYLEQGTPIQSNVKIMSAVGKIGVNNNNNTPFLGSIDLKKFSVTVDDEVVFNGLMESTKPIYDKIATTNTTLSTFETDTDNNFSAVNSALNEKANLSDLAGYVTVNKYNELLARVIALETEINGGNA